MSLAGGKDLVSPVPMSANEILSQRNSHVQNMVLHANLSDKDNNQQDSSTFDSVGDQIKAKNKNGKADAAMSSQPAGSVPQGKLQALEKKVSSLVLQMEQLRPVVKDAQRFLASETAGAGPAKTDGGSKTARPHILRSRQGSQNRRSASKEGQPVSARVHPSSTA